MKCIGCERGNKPVMHNGHCIYANWRISAAHLRPPEEQKIIADHYAKHGKPCDVIIKVSGGEASNAHT